MSDSENDNSLSSADSSERQKPIDSETVPATAYVQKPQYQKWVREADKRDQSVSGFISSMVEVGLNDIELEKESPLEIVELREQLRQERTKREELRQELKTQEQGVYHIGLGKIKELIINNPGVDRREIVNYVVENPARFADKYLMNLESSEFVNEGGKWYPPESVGDSE